MSRFATLFASVAGALALTAVAAQAAVDPALFQQLRWRSIGPFRGGRVLAVDGAPDDPRRFYFGAVNGGVWRTDDAGRTWVPIFDDAPVGSIGALAVAPSAPNVIYVGTGEADMRSDIAQGVGVFKTVDGGKTWRRIGLEDSQQIGKILVDPRDPDVLLVAALGHPYGPNPQRGVFRSADGGRTWTRTLFKNADTGAIDMAFEPGNPQVVYAALWQTRRPPWNVYPPSNGPGGGLYKSTDGGRTWTRLANGLPRAPGRIGLALSAADPRRVYALIDADDGGLYRSDDAGATWTKATGDRRIWQRGWYFGGVTANPANPDEVWVCDTIILKSEDGGHSFVPVKGDPTGDDFHSLWIDPKDPERRILGVDQGTLVTLNGGRTWSSWFNQPTGQFYHVVTDSRFPYRVYGAQQDSGAAGVPSRTDSGADGINMTQFHEITAGGESDNIAPDPKDPDIVYGGRVDRLDLKSGQTRDVDPTLAFPGAYRGTWTLPLVFGKLDHALYFGNQRIFRTNDGGEHWTPISPDLTRPNPEVPATLDAPTAADAPLPGDPRRGVVYAIGPSPRAVEVIWAGTDDGLVWRTMDRGESWINVTPKALTAWSKVGTVEPSHFDPVTAYIAVDRHRLDDFKPYVYRTHDNGRSWTPISRGLDAGGVLNAVNVVREDPKRPGLLYAGTERGLFVSFNDGDDWQPLQAGLPRTSVRDIEVHDDDLVIATHGRGFYVMDDVAALRELTADPRGGLRLFAPAPAVRERVSDFTGTPMPKDEPMAENPPLGAYIDYVLPGAAPVQIAILDAAGQEVRRYSSADVPPPPDLAKLDIAPEWRTAQAPPAATPGAHRFVWDLRYAAAPGLAEGRRRGGAGVWAPPGDYTVVLTVGGQSLRQPLTVLPDPRVKVAPEDFAREFVLARKVEASRVQVAALLEKAKDLHARLTAAAQADPARRARLLALEARLDDLARLPADNPRNSVPIPPQTVAALADISTRLDVLAQAVDGADGAPTPDAQKGYDQAVQALAAAAPRLDAIASEAGPLLGAGPGPGPGA